MLLVMPSGWNFIFYLILSYLILKASVQDCFLSVDIVSLYFATQRQQNNAFRMHNEQNVNIFIY